MLKPFLAAVLMAATPAIAKDDYMDRLEHEVGMLIALGVISEYCSFEFPINRDRLDFYAKKQREKVDSIAKSRDDIELAANRAIGEISVRYPGKEIVFFCAGAYEARNNPKAPHLREIFKDRT